MPRLSRLACVFAATATTLLAQTAFAQSTVAASEFIPTSDARLAWRCSFEADEAYNMVCVPSAFARDGRDATPAPAPTPVAATPPRGNFRAVSTRSLDEIFAVDVWRVPLFGPATDMDGVRELLRVVLCGRHPECSVQVDDLGLRAQAPMPRR